MSNTASDFVGSHFKEAIKTHLTYDGTNRLTNQYVAIATAVHGEPCMLTRYTYDGATTRVVGMNEELSTWNSAWDI